MKTLYLTAGVFDKGGISRYNRYQIEALRDLYGPERVAALSLLGPTGSRSDLETPFEVAWCGKYVAGGSKSRYAAYCAAALRLGRRLRPDIIWCAHLHFSALSWLLARVLGAVNVVQVYGREVWTDRRGRPDVFWGFRRCDAVASDCYFTASYVQAHFPCHQQVTVMWDPVDTDRFSPGRPAPEVLARYGIPDPALSFNLMSLGRLSVDAEYKGYTRLLEVFPRLPAHARLIYCGGGNLIPALRARAQALGVADRVIFAGFVDEAHLPDIYRAASVFSLVGDRGVNRGEGIPLTPLEAAACGVPILVGNQDGSAEAVEQGVNGYALDPFDLDAIAGHLTRLAADAGERVRLGRAARERIEREHAYPVFRERMRRFFAGREK